MCDKELVKEIINQMIEGCTRIKRRFHGIETADDFIMSEEGVDKLDAICMMLIAIGESAKHLDSITEGKLLILYPEIDWKGVKGIRDIISHHYFDINSDIVFSVCAEHIDTLFQTLEKMKSL